MKCDKCGRDFQWTEAEHDTHCETMGKYSVGPKLLTMCPECAASRRGMLAYWVLVIALFILASTIAFAVNKIVNFR